MSADDRAAATRQTILDAAEQVFAERGYAAASMRVIASAARTSQALLHHHFGTKAALYQAVKQRFTDRFDAERPQPSTWQPDPAFVTSMVRGYFAFLSKNPNLARLDAWARLEGDESPWGSSDAIWQRARAWVEQAKSAGLMQRDVDDRMLLVVGAAMVQYWIDNRGFLCRALGFDPADPNLDERYLRQALSILLRGAGTDALAALDPSRAGGG